LSVELYNLQYLRDIKRKGEDWLVM